MRKWNNHTVRSNSFVTFVTIQRCVAKFWKNVIHNLLTVADPSRKGAKMRQSKLMDGTATGQ